MRQYLEVRDLKEVEIKRLASKESGLPDLDKSIFVSIDCETTGLYNSKSKRKDNDGETIISLKNTSSRRDIIQHVSPSLKGSALRSSVRRIKSRNIDITEIAAVAYDFKGNDLGTIHRYFVIEDREAVSPKILELTHRTSEKDKLAIPPKDGISDLKNWLGVQKKRAEKRGGDLVIVGHNVMFDIYIIDEIAKSVGIKGILNGFHYVDTLPSANVAIEYMPKPGPKTEWKMKIHPKTGKEVPERSQGSLAEVLPLSKEERKELLTAHSALSDVKVNKPLFLHFLKGIQKGMK